MIRFALHILFFLSGAAALGYQLVWSKMFSAGLGHEFPAVLAIVCAFMAGLALGAAFLDRFVPRDAQAGWWLAAFELMIGLWAINTSFLIPHFNEAALWLMGIAPGPFKHWAVAFLVPVVTLLPATAAMGAAFPAMEKFLSVSSHGDSSVASVYAANTFGAVAGTLLTPFVLMPAMGFSKSCWVLAAMNGVVAVGAFLLVGKRVGRAYRSATAVFDEDNRPARSDAPCLKKDRASLSFERIAITLFITGLLGIGYETAGVRVLSQVLKNTVFTYATVLAVFLAGTAAGAAVYRRWRGTGPRKLLATLLSATALACCAGMLLMPRISHLYLFARRSGESQLAVFGAELLTAAVIFALPTFFMGATFSHLAQLARVVRGQIGSAVACNTVGAALAPIGCVVLIPLLGVKWTLFAASAGYVLLLPAKPNMKVALAGAVAGIAVLFSDVRVVNAPPGATLVAYREGVMASVAVFEENDNRTLLVDNHFQMGGTGAADAEYRQAHLPLLLHPEPRSALFLGVGTGISLGAASLYPNLHADGVELVPEVLGVLDRFEPQNFSPQHQSNLTLHVADARRFVRAADRRYDVIVADLFHPYRDGAGALYTREHFAAVQRRLNSGGLFCQWLPLHQLDAAALRVIVRTFLEVFPSGDAWLLRFNVDVPVVGLVGRREETEWRTNLVESRLGDASLARELKRLALGDSVRLLGHWLAGAAELRAFADNAPRNTDDNQRVTFMAARTAYQQNAKPYESLLALLAASTTNNVAAHPLSLSGNDEFARRVSRYLNARNVYLRGLVHDAENRRDEAVNAYIESARLSPEFTTGYAQCISIASAIAASDPMRARKILERLEEAQPANPVAAQMLQRLFTR